MEEVARDNKIKSFFSQKGSISLSIIGLGVLLFSAVVLPLAAKLTQQRVTTQQRAAGETKVVLSPSNSSVPVGGTVTLDINIQNVTGLYGADVRLSFDPTHLQVQDALAYQTGVQIQSGDFPDPANGFVGANTADNASGTIIYTMTLLTPAQPVSGNGTLARIVFQGVAPGSATTIFTSVTLLDNLTQPIPASTQNATITVTGGSPTATSTPSPDTFVCEISAGYDCRTASSCASPCYLTTGTPSDCTSGQVCCDLLCLREGAPTATTTPRPSATATPTRPPATATPRPQATATPTHAPIPCNGPGQFCTNSTYCTNNSGGTPTEDYGWCSGSDICCNTGGGGGDNTACLNVRSGRAGQVIIAPQATSVTKGGKVIIRVTQKPYKWEMHDTCYYAFIDVYVKTGPKTGVVCRAGGNTSPQSYRTMGLTTEERAVHGKIRSCEWDTAAWPAGTYVLEAYYGGHDDLDQLGQPGCCDTEDWGQANVIVVLPPTNTPTPTATPTQSPTPTPVCSAPVPVVGTANPVLGDTVNIYWPALTGDCAGRYTYSYSHNSKDCTVFDLDALKGVVFNQAKCPNLIPRDPVPFISYAVTRALDIKIGTDSAALGLYDVAVFGWNAANKQGPPGNVRFMVKTLTLTPTPVCSKDSLGDANCDGLINSADFLIWRDEYLGDSTGKTADFNADNKIDLKDFGIWRKNAQ